MRRYWFVLVALLSVFSGLALSFSKQEAAANLAWAAGAALGFYFSLNWLIAAIRGKELGSDVLALLSICATALTNEWLAASIIALMLSTGRALENWAEGQASKHLDALLARAPQHAHLVGENNQIKDVDIKIVPVGSRVLVKAGEVVPFDGEVESEALFDESALTGESLPVWHMTGELVHSGVLNVGKEVILRTTETSENSTYANLIRLVSNARNQASKGVRLANIWAARFVPIAIGLALATYLVSMDIKQAVAVIVAATPCPLILAVPVALVSGISRAAKRGVIIKEGEAIERLAKAEVVLLDKTGTLTHGGPQISSIIAKDETKREYYLALAASLEQHSSNVVARALVAHALANKLQSFEVTNVAEIHGHGLSGVVDNHRVIVGQPELPLPSWASVDHALLVEIQVDDEIEVIIGMDDPLRSDALDTVTELRNLGVKRVLLVSGDRNQTVAQIADELSITEYFAECSPEHKLEILETEKKLAVGSVVVVGDGINDAPALAAADVGVAMGAKGNTAASQAAMVVIIEDSIRRLVDAIDISKLARTRALQASSVGMGLALITMVLASVGLVNPNESALLQEAIDATAIIWALAPKRQSVQPKQQQ